MHHVDNDDETSTRKLFPLPKDKVPTSHFISDDQKKLSDSLSTSLRLPSLGTDTYSKKSLDSELNGAVFNGCCPLYGSHNHSNSRTRYLSTLGIWTEDRAKALTDRSSEEIVGRSKQGSLLLHPRVHSNNKKVYDNLIPEELHSSSSPSLEALLLRGKSPPISVPRTSAMNEVKEYISTEETDSMASSFETVGSVESSGCRQSIDAIDLYLLPAKPRRRDVRRNYLAKVGIETSPASIIRSVTHPSPAFDLDIRLEKLKDPQYQDLTFDDLVKVLGGLVGVSAPKDTSPKPQTPCITCKRSSSGQSSSKHNQLIPCPHKRVRFSETVSAVYIPVHYDYSNRVRASYWASAAEIREMVYRNMLEFDSEGYEWQNVVEEENMYYNEESKEYIHPAFFDTLVQVTHEESETTLINEGRKLPRMEKNQGIWA
jgi:hypothetical protein